MRVLSSGNHPKSSSYWYYYLTIVILIVVCCCSHHIACFSSTTTTALINRSTHQKYSSQQSSSFGYLFMTPPNNEESTTSTTIPLKDQEEEDMQFGKFKISSKNIFYRSSLHGTFGFVNLRPIVPGHVLVTPRRVVPLLSDLTHDEYVDLWTSVRRIQTMLTTHLQQQTSSETKTKISFNVAVQDGPSAGQSVPHVHVHILPRLEGDFERNDDVYDELEAWAPQETNKPKTNIDVPDDQDRHDRTSEQMEEEATMYRNLF